MTIVDGIEMIQECKKFLESMGSHVLAKTIQEMIELETNEKVSLVIINAVIK